MSGPAVSPRVTTREKTMDKMNDLFVMIAVFEEEVKL
jgi:hypothetical protein